MACSILDAVLIIDANSLHAWAIILYVDPKVFRKIDTMPTSSKGLSSVEAKSLHRRAYSRMFSCDSSLIFPMLGLRGRKSKLVLKCFRKTCDKSLQVQSLPLSRFINHLRAWPSRLCENRWIRSPLSLLNWNISLQYVHKCVWGHPPPSYFVSSGTWSLFERCPLGYGFF